MTSTCARDHALACRLHAQLERLGLDHFLVVEVRDRPAFQGVVADDRLLTKPDGGDNGFGRTGSLVKWACHQAMRAFVGDGDTFVNVDSDVLFQTEALAIAMACEADEIKGFGGDPRTFEGTAFLHISGMCFAAHSSVFHRAWSISRGELESVCLRMDTAGICPSEDVTASWLYKARGGATKVTLLDERYTRGAAPTDDLLHSRSL
jgi:hypothetical protein